MSNQNVSANQGQSTTITDVHTRSIEEIRNQGLDQSTLQKFQQDKVEMDRLEKENASRLKGNYISFKEDQETKTLLFTGKYQKVNVPAKDFSTGLVIPNKFVAKWRWECYNIPNNVVSIWERGWKESKTIMHFLGEGRTELVIVRNGAKGSNTTTYLIYPASTPVVSSTTVNSEEDEGDRLQNEYWRDQQTQHYEAVRKL